MLIEPLGFNVLIKKDEDRHVTKGGIELPGNTKIPVLTGRILEIGRLAAEDSDCDLQKYERVIIEPASAIPVDFEKHEGLFIVSYMSILGVYREQIEERVTV